MWIQCGDEFRFETREVVGAYSLNKFVYVTVPNLCSPSVDRIRDDRNVCLRHFHPLLPWMACAEVIHIMATKPEGSFDEAFCADTEGDPAEPTSRPLVYCAPPV